MFHLKYAFNFFIKCIPLIFGKVYLRGPCKWIVKHDSCVFFWRGNFWKNLRKSSSIKLSGFRSEGGIFCYSNSCVLAVLQVFCSIIVHLCCCCGCCYCCLVLLDIDVRCCIEYWYTTCMHSDFSHNREYLNYTQSKLILWYLLSFN
jgi:hypothetical protein